MMTQFVIDDDVKFFTEGDQVRYGQQLSSLWSTTKIVRYGQQLSSLWSTTWFVAVNDGFIVSKDDVEK